MNTLFEEKEALYEESLLRLSDNTFSPNMRIVAEGDSWFDYPPQKDIIDHLRQMGYAIDKNKLDMANAGDTLENMVYGEDYTIHRRQRAVSNPGPVSLHETIDAIDQYKPRFVLFSAGGNDVVGSEMIFFLNHKESGTNDLLKEKLFRNHVEGPMKVAIKTFISKVTKVKSDIDILMEGWL